METVGEDFIVDTQPTKEVVVSSLTKDATVEACLFDLIDNSIDAARERLLTKSKTGDSRIPDDFSSYEISLEISAEGVRISDNCGGIPFEALESMVLRFGKPSSQELGIGVYGVGLNRAIFKLGTLSHLSTDTGKIRSELTLDVEQYLRDDKEWGLPAKKFLSTGTIGTELSIEKPTPEISDLLGDADFVAEVADDISRRYCKFLDRGLTLILNGDHIVGREVQMRENGPFQIERKFYRTGEGVTILMQVGEHESHRFFREPEYDRDHNKALTPEYGWTVYCNDRAIVVSDTSRLTGWDTKFHSEFYGFVATVDFVSSDPSKLPWNTTKTQLDLNNPAYQLALDDMRKFAERWRSFTARYKKQRKEKDPISIPPAPVNSSKKPTPAPVPTPSPAPKGDANSPAVKEGHNDLRFVLPADINEYHCSDKFLEVVHEAKTLDVGTHPYAALALIRMLFEFSLSHFMNREKRGQELVKFVIDRREQESGKKVKDKSSVSPKLEECLAFFEANPDIWGPLASNHIKQSVRKLKGYVPEINGALHNPYQPIHRTKVFQIRDEAIAGLRYLIEYPTP